MSATVSAAEKVADTFSFPNVVADTFSFLRRSNSSRARASRSTATSGPLPDRKTAWAASSREP